MRTFVPRELLLEFEEYIFLKYKEGYHQCLKKQYIYTFMFSFIHIYYVFDTFY